MWNSNPPRLKKKDRKKEKEKEKNKAQQFFENSVLKIHWFKNNEVEKEYQAKKSL